MNGASCVSDFEIVVVLCGIVGQFTGAVLPSLFYLNIDMGLHAFPLPGIMMALAIITALAGL
jgi:hypothetical protein